MRFKIFVVAFFCITFLSINVFGKNQNSSNQNKLKYIPGKILVKFKPQNQNGLNKISSIQSKFAIKKVEQTISTINLKKEKLELKNSKDFLLSMLKPQQMLKHLQNKLQKKREFNMRNPIIYIHLIKFQTTRYIQNFILCHKLKQTLLGAFLWAIALSQLQ